MMTRDDMNELLDIYGADLSRWPQDKLKDVLALTEKDAAARADFDAALALEQTLRDYTPAQARLDALEARILAAVASLPAAEAIADKQASEGGFFRWRPAYIFAPSGCLLAAAVFGFIIGMQPTVKQEHLMNPVYYQTEQILADDSALYDGRIF